MTLWVSRYWMTHECRVSLAIKTQPLHLWPGPSLLWWAANDLKERLDGKGELILQSLQLLLRYKLSGWDFSYFSLVTDWVSVNSPHISKELHNQRKWLYIWIKELWIISSSFGVLHEIFGAFLYLQFITSRLLSTFQEGRKWNKSKYQHI